MGPAVGRIFWRGTTYLSNMSTIYENVLHRLLTEGAASSDTGVRAFSFRGPTKGASQLSATAYDLKSLRHKFYGLVELPDSVDLTEIFRSSILGAINVKKAGRGCGGAWEVTGVKGPGHGKLTYGMGYYVVPSHRLIPDRNSLTPTAQAAWRAVAEKAARGEASALDLSTNSCKLWKHVPGSPNNPAKDGALPDADIVAAVNKAYTVPPEHDYVTMIAALQDFVESLWTPRGNFDRQRGLGTVLMAMNVAHSDYLTGLGNKA